MGETYEQIEPHLAAWIARQPLFFVGTAPLAGDGHVNVSPKGPIGTLQVLGPRRVAYLDFFGSGAETAAHLRENGRIVVMLCAFDGPPRIVRLHGAGRVVPADEPEFGSLLAAADFAPVTVEEARRAMVVVDVTRVSTSCGYLVPEMQVRADRPHFDLSKRKRLRTMGPEAMRRFQAERNAASIDGLPAVTAAPTDRGG